MNIMFWIILFLVLLLLWLLMSFLYERVGGLISKIVSDAVDIMMEDSDTEEKKSENEEDVESEE